MKPIKIYCIKCNKFRKFMNSKISCFFYKTLVLSINRSKCGDSNDRVFNDRRRKY